MLIPVSKELLFVGRPGDQRLGEWVNLALPPTPEPNSIILMGCPDDKGVSLNRGRAGAKQGPEEIRKAFYKMTFPMDSTWNALKVFDAGNIPVTDDILETHENAFRAAEELAQKSQTLILLGGGHDFAAPGFMGFMSGRLKANPKETFSLINVDPHLDVRELEQNSPHSGTPFRQILEQKTLPAKRFVEFGCRENRNSTLHFDYCRKLGTHLAPLENLRKSKKPISELFKSYLNTLSSASSCIGVTLDLDSCQEILGTSATPAIGFTVRELFEIAFLAGSHPKVGYFELAELAPPLDPSGKSALAAAEILYGFLSGRSRINKIHKTPLKASKTKKTVKRPKKS
jgi:formiminoglutamase